jgi:hypothetical protein
MMNWNNDDDNDNDYDVDMNGIVVDDNSHHEINV